jgi:Na+/proline symporter
VIAIAAPPPFLTEAILYATLIVVSAVVALLFGLAATLLTRFVVRRTWRTAWIVGGIVSILCVTAIFVGPKETHTVKLDLPRTN